MLHTVSNTNIDVDMIQADDAVLFWQNGVILALTNNAMLNQIKAKTSHCYALNNDILARGLLPLVDKDINVIDMDKMVTLTETFFPQMKW